MLNIAMNINETHQITYIIVRVLVFREIISNDSKIPPLIRQTNFKPTFFTWNIVYLLSVRKKYMPTNQIIIYRL